MRIRIYVLFSIVILSNSVYSQIKSIEGTIYSTNDVEGVHIINVTSKKYAATDKSGRFVIDGKIQDTLHISSLIHRFKEVVISSVNIETQQMDINLEERINELEEIVIRDFSGNLELDLKESNVKRSIDFYDFGIPGYKGPKLTQNEKRLYDARTNSGLLGLNGIINRIFGRTKQLETIIDLERRTKLIKVIELQFSESFFSLNDLESNHRKDFFFLF